MSIHDTKSWPYVEARRIGPKDQDIVTFETGYGPSGCPTISTWCEVYRTSLVRRAYEELYGTETRLIVFSDDKDAMRRVPDNVPNQEMLKDYIGVSLSHIPDPYGEYESFAHHNNAMLRRFLDRFDFDYEFMSSTEMYAHSLQFHCGVLYSLEVDIIRPTLGADRAETYSPFMPIDPETHHVYETKILNYSVRDALIEYINPRTGQHTIQSIYRGNCKLQWKADWAMRQVALAIDYEMCGKDLTDSVKLSSQIVRELGYTPPTTMIYEMFLDEHGKKISKSKGNGLSFDEWMKYGSGESMRYYLFQAPQRAKELSKGIVARSNDEYLRAAASYTSQTDDQKLSNAVHFIHGDQPIEDMNGVTFSLLLNLAATVAPEVPTMLWSYVERFVGFKMVPAEHPIMRDLVLCAFNYYWDVLAGNLNPRLPMESEYQAISDLLDQLYQFDATSSAIDIQTAVYAVGKDAYGKENLRDWFKMLYEVLLGQDSGPRFGEYVVMCGLDNTIKMLESKLVAQAE
jgi:lysyl-tRNA synthetase class 1